LIIKDINGVEVGLNKPVTYSSLYVDTPPIPVPLLSITNGVDAISSWPNIYHSAYPISPNEFLQVDLGQEYQIGSIKYWNRDTNQDRSNGTFIQLIANNGTTIVKTINLVGNLPSELFTFSNIDETVQTYNTDLTGTSIILKDAYQNQKGTTTIGTASNTAGTINGSLPGYAETINF
jgi:hypothetical protein